MSKRSITRAGLGALAVAGALAAAPAAPAAASAEYLGYHDLFEGQWYVSSGLVDWSEERGVVNGVDGEWLPDGPVDRAQAAAILFNYSGDAAPAEGATFDDAGELGWAADACAWAQDEGVFNDSEQPGGGEPAYDAYDISGPGYRIVERGYMTEDGEMGGCRYNGHKMYSYFPETNVVVFDPDGKQLLSEGDDNPGEDEFRSTASIDYDNDTITYTVTGLGRYHGTASITVGFSRFSSVYISAPKCPACGGSLDVDYPYSILDDHPMLYAYRCVDSESETPHACSFVEGKKLNDLLLKKDADDGWITLGSDEDVLVRPTPVRYLDGHAHRLGHHRQPLARGRDR